MRQPLLLVKNFHSRRLIVHGSGVATLTNYINTVSQRRVELTMIDSGVEVVKTKKQPSQCTMVDIYGECSSAVEYLGI